MNENWELGIRNWELGIGNEEFACRFRLARAEICALALPSAESRIKTFRRLGISSAERPNVQDQPEVTRPPSTFRNGQDIRDRAFSFGCRVAKFCERLREQGGNASILAPQLLRCATAAGALPEAAG